MFVPVIAYDPDLFADFVFVLSQIEISANSQPLKRSTSESISGVSPQRVADTLPLTLVVYQATQILAQKVSDADQIVLNSPAASQVQSKFTSRTFTSKLAAPTLDVPLVSGSFVTQQEIEPLYDNLVFRVQVSSLDLSDTKANNKPVAPVVS